MDNRYDCMKGRYYKHYKGGIYQVIDVAIHTEENYPLVIYKGVIDNKVWARPFGMFNGYVLLEREDGTKYHEERFKQVIVDIKEVKLDGDK